MRLGTRVMFHESHVWVVNWSGMHIHVVSTCPVKYPGPGTQDSTMNKLVPALQELIACGGNTT